MAYLRPNLLDIGKLVLIRLFLLLLMRRSDGPAGAHAPSNVLLFLFGWLEDLIGKRVHCLVMYLQSETKAGDKRQLTWKEHSKLSSTLIIAPALSNSPQ